MAASCDDQILDFQIASEITMQPIIPRAEITRHTNRLLHQVAQIRPPVVMAEEGMMEQTKQHLEDFRGYQRPGQGPKYMNRSQTARTISIKNEDLREI